MAVLSEKESRRSGQGDGGERCYCKKAIAPAALALGQEDGAIVGFTARGEHHGKASSGRVFNGQVAACAAALLGIQNRTRFISVASTRTAVPICT